LELKFAFVGFDCLGKNAQAVPDELRETRCPALPSAATPDGAQFEPPHELTGSRIKCVSVRANDAISVLFRSLGDGIPDPGCRIKNGYPAKSELGHPRKGSRQNG
jgi:hypothetical protein